MPGSVVATVTPKTTVTSTVRPTGTVAPTVTRGTP